jgi:hypothetical protein
MTKYIGPDGYSYTPEQLNSYPKPSTTEKIGNAISSIGQSVIDFGSQRQSRNLNELTGAYLANDYDALGKQSADDAARTVEAGRILNSDPNTFIGAKAEIQIAAKEKLKMMNNSPEDWDSFVQNYPKTTEYLSNKSNMAVSHDDINNLSYQEQMVNVMSDSYKLNTLSQERADIGNRLLGSVYGLDGLSMEEKTKLEDLDNQIRSLQEKLPRSTWSVPGVLAGIAGMAPSVQTGFKYGLAGAAAGAGFGALAGGVGAVPGAFAGLGQGFRVGFAKDFAATSMGNLYLDEISSGVDPTEAAKGAAVSGAGTAVLSSAQIGKWLKLPEASKVGLKSLGLNVLEQSAIGAGLTATDVAGRKVAEGNTFQWGMQDIEQIAEGGINMVPLAIAMALPGHGYVALKNLGDMVDKSKTAQRSPDLVAEKINAEVAGTPLENVSIPGVELFDYLQNVAEVNPKEAQQIINRLGVEPKEISEAIQTGGDISVKLGNFEVLPKEHREALLEDVKIGEQPNKRNVEESYIYREQAAEPSISKEIGLGENKFYADAVAEAKTHAETVLSNRVKAENSPAFQGKLNKHLEEVKKTIEAQLENDPMYRASDAISFDLQLFSKGLKNVKEVAQKYIEGNLSDKQKAWIDTIAEQHSFSSGNELVKKIRNNKLKDEEIKTRLEYASEQFKKDELGDRTNVQAEAEISKSKIKSSALEASALNELAKGNHRNASREKKISDATSRFKNAETSLLVEIQKSKGDSKVNALKEQLAELKKSHAEEIKQLNEDAKYTARWYEAESKTKDANLKEQQKNDNAMAKEWLNAETTSQRIARQSEIGIKAALEYAKTTLMDKPINDAIAYSKYMKQAREAARKSEKEYRAGKYEQASKWKNTEMINHAMALEAMKLNKDFAKQEKYIKSVISKKRELFKTDENFNQVGSMLDRFGVGRKDYIINSKSETLVDWSNRMNEMLGSVNIPQWLNDESIRKNYKELTMPELKDVTDALKNIQKVANQEKTSIAVAKGESLDALRLEMIAEMNKLETAFKPKIEASALDRFKSGVSNYLYQLQTMSTVVSRLQGWKTFGSLEKFWIAPVHERANLESNRINQFKTELETMWGTYTAKERKAMANDKVYYEELGASTTKMKLLAMAFNLGNEGNSSKLFSTRPYGVESTKPWGRQTVMDLLSNNLDKRDWQTVQKTWDLINTLWPELSKFHAEMTGFEPKKVEAAPFEVTLRNGETIQLAGGYYPLKQDPRSSLISAERESAESPLYTEQNPAWKATTKTGFTKQRSNANYSIDLDTALINRHIIDVVHDLYFRDLVSDYRRMLNNKEFQLTVQSKLGPEGLKQFSDHVSNIANGESYRNVGMSAIEKTVDYLRKAGTKAAITFRVGVITQNAANMLLYPKAIEGFGAIDATTALLKHGLLNYIPKSAFNWNAAKQVREEIYNLSPYMRDRRQTPDYSLHDIQSNMFGSKNAISEFGIGLLSASDDLTAVPMWKQAYEKKLGETADSKQSAYYADSLIKAVNGSGRKYDVSPIMRSKSVMEKTFSSFYMFMNVEFNRWVKESGMATQDGMSIKGIENAPRFIGFVASRVILFSIASDILAGKGPEEEEDPAAYYGSKVLSYPLQLLPVVRDIAPIIIDSSLGLHSYGYRPSVAYSEFDAISKLATKAQSYAKGTGKTNEQDVAEAVAKVASYGTGYPDQMNAWFFNAYDYFVNSMDPELIDMMKRRPKKKRAE